MCFAAGPPKIGRFSFLSDQEEGLRNQLNCMVTSGDLPMTVTWLKDGSHLQHDSDMSVKQTSEFSSVSSSFSMNLNHLILSYEIINGTASHFPIVESYMFFYLQNIPISEYN